MEKIYNHKITINKEQNSLRLDQALAKLSNFSRSQIKILLTNRNITNINGEVTDASYRVKEGEKYILKIIVPKEDKFMHFTNSYKTT